MANRRIPLHRFISRRQFGGCLILLSTFAANRKAVALDTGSPVYNGQSINLTNVGRAGAALYGVPNYSADLTTLERDQTYSTDQTIRNTNFLGIVKVTGGNVVFEFCSFTTQPPSARIAPGGALQQYNGGEACGTVTCNWCDFDSGLRGSQGSWETEAFNAGERTRPITNQPSSFFTLFRCHVQGFGNGISLDGWQCGPSDITECYIGDCTSGEGTHMDGIEIYSSDNIVVQRCRLVGRLRGTSFLNITNDWGQTANSNPIIIRNNMILPDGDAAPILIAINNNNSTYKTNVSVIDNYFGDHTWFPFEIQLAGNERPMRGLNVTFDQGYFNAAYKADEPGLVYWSKGNVWTPNGEGIRNPVGHKPGNLVSQKSFSNGQLVWTGRLLGGSAESRGR